MGSVALSRQEKSMQRLSSPRVRFYVACLVAPVVMLVGLAATYAANHAVVLPIVVGLGLVSLIFWVLQAHVRQSRVTGPLLWARCMVVAVGLAFGMAAVSFVAASVAAMLFLPARYKHDW
jgi:membrane protease YdiL (CAAX protease family)